MRIRRSGRQLSQTSRPQDGPVLTGRHLHLPLSQTLPMWECTLMESVSGQG